MSDDWDEGAVVVQPVSIPQRWPSSSNSNKYDDVWESSGGTTVNYNSEPARENRSRVFTNRGGRGFGARGSNSGRGSNRGGGGGGQGRYQNSSNEISEVLNIPTRYIGRIIGGYLSQIKIYFFNNIYIGRGGSKIAELQTESNARIQVTKDTVDDDTIVKIFGDTESVLKAKDLILDLAKDNIKFVSSEDASREVYKPKPAIIDWQTLLKESVSNISYILPHNTRYPIYIFDEYQF